MGVGESKVTFERSFIRNFLSLPLPVIVAVLLSHWISGESLQGIRFFVGDATKNALVSFVPLSILFLEGNQSVADRLSGIAIRAEHESANLLPKVEAKTWVLLCSSNLAWALLYASLWYLAVTKPLNGPPKPLPAGVQGAWIVNDPQTQSSLWAILPMGLKEPTFGIRRIELLEESPSPFSYRAEQSNFIVRVNLEPYLKQLNKMPVVRVVLTRDLPLQVKLLVVQNFLSYVGKNTPMERRPAFSLLQIATEKEFGLFGIDQQENILVCWTISSKNSNDAWDFFTDVQPHGSIRFPISLDKTGFLLIGAGIPYW